MVEKDKDIWKKNPFPSLAVVTKPEDVKYTLDRKGEVKTIKRVVKKCLFDKEGRVVSIVGDVGSGKTHLLMFLQQLLKKLKEEEQKPINYVNIYVNNPGGTFLDLYKEKIIPEIDYRFLGDVAIKWISIVARGKAEKVDWMEKSAEALRKEPYKVLDLIERDLLPSTEIMHEQNKELEMLAPTSDFVNAFAGFIYPKKDRIAYRWFCCEELTKDEMDELGVNSKINSDEMAIKALLLLVSVLNKVGHSFFLFIDEFEVLLNNTEPAKIPLMHASLRQLFQFMYKEQGCLALACTIDAWGTLSPAVKERFTENIKLVSLTDENMLKLIKGYLESENIEPFEEDAIEKIHKISRGNMRQILSLCYQSFELARDAKDVTITLEIVQSASSRVEMYKESNIFSDIDNVLKSLGARYVRGAKIRGDKKEFTIDYAIPDLENLAISIKLSTASYLEEEASNALELVQYSSVMKKKYPQSGNILILDGYISDEIQSPLSSIFDYLTVYDPEKFESDIRYNIQTFLEAGANGGKDLEAKMSEYSTISHNQLYSPQVLEKILSELNDLRKERVHKEEEIYNKFGMKIERIDDMMRELHELRYRYEGLRQALKFVVGLITIVITIIIFIFIILRFI